MELLKVEELCKVYGKGENEVRAVDGVSFSVSKGQMVAIIGASGSGKSTLLHLLGAVDQPTSGKVWLDGQDVFKHNKKELAIFRRRQVGLIYQFYNLNPVLTAEENIPRKNYYACWDRDVGGIRCIVSRTGYTGSDGFELYTDAKETEKLWDLLLEAGRDEGLIPCGLGARDTLRLEAGMPLYGHELSDTISPLTSGLGYFVKMDKPDFIGKKAMEEAGAPTRCRVGLKAIGRGIPREHQDVYDGDRLIGHTTSGTHCPYVGYPASMAIVDIAYKVPGTHVEVDVRGRRVEAEVVRLPFYRK